MTVRFSASFLRCLKAAFLYSRPSVPLWARETFTRLNAHNSQPPAVLVSSSVLRASRGIQSPEGKNGRSFCRWFSPCYDEHPDELPPVFPQSMIDQVKTTR